MTAAYLAPQAKFKAWDNNGNPLAGGLLTTYQAGTVIASVTYTDSTASTANPTTIVLNARGEASVWIPPNVAYKFVLTDSAGNLIWTVDQIVNSQLVTLYGGVDTGSVNAYILSYVSNVQTLTNGVIVYWTPSNTNTGNSTINVSLTGGTSFTGPIPILNQDGSQLGAGQIVANGITALFYYNGNWLLTSSTGSVAKAGSFLATYVGGTASPASGTAYWSQSGNVVTLVLPNLPGTSTSTSFSYSGLPASLQPPTQQQNIPVSVGQNNSAFVAGIFAVIAPSSGSIQFGLLGNLAGWTATGTKYVGIFSTPFYYGITLTYSLI